MPCPALIHSYPRIRHQRGEVGVSQERQELQRPTDDVLPCAGPSRRLVGAPEPTSRRDPWARRRRAPSPGFWSWGAGRRPSSTPSAAPSRFLTRAQNCAITIESAPRSSKKLLSTGTWSTCSRSASTSARILSTGAATGATRRERRRQAPDGGVLVDVLHRHRRQVRRASGPVRRTGPSPSSRRRGRRRSCCRPARARRAARPPAPRRGSSRRGQARRPRIAGAQPPQARLLSVGCW